MENMDLLVALVVPVGVIGVCVLGFLLMFNRIRLTTAMFSMSFPMAAMGSVQLFVLFRKGFVLTYDVAFFVVSLWGLGFAIFFLWEAMKNKNRHPVIDFSIDKQTIEEASFLIENFIASGLSVSLSPNQKARLVALVCFYNKGLTVSEKLDKSTFLKMVDFVCDEQGDVLGVILSAIKKFISVLYRSQLVMEEKQRYRMVNVFIGAFIDGEIKKAEGDVLEEVIINKLSSVLLS